MAKKNKFTPPQVQQHTNPYVKTDKKTKKPKVKFSFYVVLVLMVFWTVCSCLTIFNTSSSCTVKADSSSETVQPYATDDPSIYEPEDMSIFNYPTANLYNFETFAGFYYIQDRPVGVSYTTIDGGKTFYTQTSAYKFGIYAIQSFIKLPAGNYSFSADTLLQRSGNINSSFLTICLGIYNFTTNQVFRVLRNEDYEDWTRWSYSFELEKESVIGFICQKYDDRADPDSVFWVRNIMLNPSSTPYPYLPYYLSPTVQEGGSSIFSGVFTGCTLSGKIVYLDESDVDNLRELDIYFNNFVPDFIQYGIRLDGLYKACLNQFKPAGADISLDSIEDFTITFAEPFVFSSNNSFFYVGQNRTSVMDTYLTLQDGNVVYGNNDYIYGDFWGPVFTEESQQYFAKSPVVKLQTNFGRADDLISNMAITMPDDSYYVGYNKGLVDGQDNGFLDGYNNAKDEFYTSRYNIGYNAGYNAGVSNANEYSFLGLFGAIIDAPIQAVSGLLNFDLLGFNMLNFFYALITCALVIAIIRLVL